MSNIRLCLECEVLFNIPRILDYGENFEFVLDQVIDKSTIFKITLCNMAMQEGVPDS